MNAISPAKMKRLLEAVDALLESRSGYILTVDEICDEARGAITLVETEALDELSNAANSITSELQEVRPRGFNPYA